MITPGYYLAKKAQENASDVSMTFLRHLKHLYMSLANIKYVLCLNSYMLG